MLNWSAKKYINVLKSKKEDFWMRQGEKMALNLFKSASRRVPAYKQFLNDNRINPEKIRTIDDFKNVPSVNKKNYLRNYSFTDLCWDGNPGLMDMVSVSSGSTGQPFYWLRGKDQEREAALTLESFYIDSFGIDRQSTLFIVSLAMGVWIGGTLIHRTTQTIAESYNMTVVTPGINISEVFKIIKSIGAYYDQIIIAGYPPFVKDIIDQGGQNDIDWKRYKIKFLFAAEAFSEKWREYLYEKVGAKDRYRSSINIYGTADAVIMAHETPFSNLIRKTVSSSRPELYKSIFLADERVPTLAQYNPAFKYTEVEDGKLIFSSFSGIPLIRYDLGDRGNILKYSEMKAILASGGIDIEKEAKNEGINIWKIPFVYVHGRSDFTATLYGINIYPETLRDALSSDNVSDYVSGKFTMLTKNDDKLNQYLEINIELKNSIGINADLGARVRGTIVRFLKDNNTEYNELYKTMGPLVEPKVMLRQYGDKDFFALGIKQKWRKI